MIRGFRPVERADFRCWPLTSKSDVRSHVGYRRQSGLNVLTVSFVVREPKLTSMVSLI
jgi:hypothetical protein